MYHAGGLAARTSLVGERAVTSLCARKGSHMSNAKCLPVRKIRVEANVRRRGNRGRANCSHPQIRRGPLALVLGLAAWILGGGFAVAQTQTSTKSFSNPLVQAPDAAAK